MKVARKILFFRPVELAAFLILVLLIGFRYLPDVAAPGFWEARLPPKLVLPFFQRDAFLAIRIGGYYFNGGAHDLSSAFLAYKKALVLNPNTRLAHYQIARIRFLEGKFSDALREINKELELHPEIPNSYYVRGLIEGYSHKYQEAEQDFRTFIERVPENWAGYNDLAWIQARRGKFKEAKATVERAFARLPGEKTRNLWLWTSYGVANLNLKEYTEAKEAFFQAREISQRVDAAFFWSAYPGNDQAGAEDAFKQFLGTLHFNLGIVYEKLGESEKARKEYERYLAYLPYLSKDVFPGAVEIKEKIKELDANL